MGRAIVISDNRDVRTTTAMDFAFSIRSIRFDEDYRPSENTRATTNFANLARGESRRENLRDALRMIDNRCNALAPWDNPEGDRYAIKLEIVSVDMDLGRDGEVFPVIEMLKTSLLDRHRNILIDGIVGNNFSSYLRDYDFSIRLPKHNEGRAAFGVPESFGELHGRIFRRFVGSDAYARLSAKPPVICLSISHDKSYRRTENRHPLLGVEYRTDDTSLTEAYFREMGMQVRYFMPEGGVAPLAFYFVGDLLNDYTTLELVGTIATMESFQRIYRPEVYNANAPAPRHFRPSLQHRDHSLTRIVYDREERRHLAVAQGGFAEKSLIEPYGALLHEWAASGD